MSVKNQILLIIYILSGILIIIGNATILLLVIFRKHLQTCSNFFIISLAVADLVIGCFVIPSSLYEQITNSSNAYKCHIVPYLQLVSVCASVYSLLGIGVDRYRSIIQVTKPKISLRKAKVIIAILWAFAFLYGLRTYTTYLHTGELDDDDDDHISINYPSINDSLDDDNITVTPITVVQDEDGTKSKPICNLLRDEETSDVFVRWCDLMVLFLVPICLLSYIYIKIVLSLWGRQINATNPATLRRKKSTVKICLMVMVLFVICWAPFHFVEVTFDTLVFIDGKFEGIAESNEALKQMTIVLAFCNSWMNPVLYMVMNTNFKHEIKALLRKGCQSCNKFTATVDVSTNYAESMDIGS